MGCVGPKSVIQVRNDATFLDLTVQQIEVSQAAAAVGKKALCVVNCVWCVQ